MRWETRESRHVNTYEPHEIARIVGGELRNGSSGAVTGVSIDSRRTNKGDLFVAVTTQTNDGHRYVPAAFASGAKAAFVSREQAEAHLRDWDIFTLIAVDDPVAALQRWSQAHRRAFAIPVVAVTGSNGKTTTKDLIAAALGSLGPVLKTEGTLNNHLGVPLTLLGITGEHRAAVVELGMNHAGEIRLLGRLTEAQIGVITNAGQAHLEFFPSLDALIDVKWELAETLIGERLLILNRDDPGLLVRGETYESPVSWFGMESECEWRPMEAEQADDGCWSFSVRGVRVELRIPGRHMISNALAALAVANALGVPLDTAADGIGQTEPTERRMRSFWLHDILILDDTYNANPSSMRAALTTLTALAPRGNGRRIAVLGGMHELGKQSAVLHRQVGAFAAAHGAFVLAVGKAGASVAEGARLVDSSSVLHMGTCEEASKWLAEQVKAGDVVLVKGSRAERMEHVIDALQAHLCEVVPR